MFFIKWTNIYKTYLYVKLCLEINSVFLERTIN